MEDNREKKEESLKEVAQAAAADLARQKIRDLLLKTPKYEDKSNIPLPSSPSSKEPTAGSWSDTNNKRLKSGELESFVPNRQQIIHPTPEKVGDFKAWYDEDISDLEKKSDIQLNKRSKEGRSSAKDSFKNRNYRTWQDSDNIYTPEERALNRQYARKAIKQAKMSEEILDSRGLERVPRTRKGASRPFYYKKDGWKKLRALGPIGMAAGLAFSDDVSAAVDPMGSETIAIDRAIEDPSSPEFKERRRRMLIQQLLEKGNNDE